VSEEGNVLDTLCNNGFGKYKLPPTSRNYIKFVFTTDKATEYGGFRLSWRILPPKNAPTGGGGAKPTAECPPIPGALLLGDRSGKKQCPS